MKKIIWVILGIISLGFGAWVCFGFVNRQYMGWERYTVIRSSGKDIVIQSIDEGRGIEVRLPSMLVVETVQGKGEWQVGALPALGKKYGRGWEADSISAALGIFYTGWADNLGIIDRLVWWQKSREVSFVKLDLADSPYVDEVVQADGVKVWRLNDAWKKKAQDLFSNVVLASSDIEAEVINTTPLGGLASLGAQALTTAGIRVTRVGEQENLVSDRCVISGSRVELDSVVGKYVKKYMRCRVVASGEDDKRITVLVGQKYKEWFRGD